MDQPTELQRSGSWRTAVWALRAGYAGLATALVGLVLVAVGSTPWVLAAGVITWLAAAAVTLTGFLATRRRLASPRPTLWSMRLMLIHDSVHARTPAPAP